MKKILVLVIIWAVGFTTTHAQIITYDTTFAYTDGSGSWINYTAAVYTKSDSSFVTISQALGINDYREPIVTTGFNYFGELLYQKPFGRDSTFYIIGYPGSTIKTFENGYVMAGYGGWQGVDEWSTLWKFNSEGDSVFLKEFQTISTDTFENFNAVVQLPDSGFVAAGFFYINANSIPNPTDASDVYFVRTDKNGGLIWQKRINASWEDRAYSVILNSENQLVFAGFQHNQGSLTALPWIFVTDLDGNVLYDLTFPNLPSNYFFFFYRPRIWLTSDNQYLLLSDLDSALQQGEFETPLFIAKMDTDFNFIWQTNFHGPTPIVIYNVRQFEDSTILVVGTESDSITNYDLGFVSKLLYDGTKEWEKLYYYQSSHFNLLYDIDQYYDCGYAAVGTTDAPQQVSWLLKMDKYGCINPVCDTSASSCGVITNPGWQEVSTLDLDANVFPNPARDELNVFYNVPQEIKDAQLIITDLNGRLLTLQPLPRASHLVKLDISKWACGMYFCFIQAGVKRITKKVIVE